MNSFEVAYQKETAETYCNIVDCKECKFFVINGRKPTCNFESTNIDDCIIVTRRLQKIP